MPNEEAKPTKARRLTLEEMRRAVDQMWERAGPDVDRTPVTKADFDALFEEPHGDFSKTDIRSAL